VQVNSDYQSPHRAIICRFSVRAGGSRLLVVGFRSEVTVVGYRLSAIGCRSSVVGSAWSMTRRLLKNNPAAHKVRSLLLRLVVTSLS
jgi:hypothetical protein